MANFILIFCGLIILGFISCVGKLVTGEANKEERGWAFAFLFVVVTVVIIVLCSHFFVNETDIEKVWLIFERFL